MAERRISEQLAHYSFPEPQTLVAIVESKLKMIFEDRIDSFDEHPVAWVSLREQMFARDLRRIVAPVGHFSEVAVGV